MSKALITDFDNTLYDWFDVWHSSFAAMLDEVEAITGLDRNLLIQEARRVHQRHRTSDYAYLLHEMPSLLAASEGKTGRVFKRAIEAYQAAGRRALRPYDGVVETLRELRSRDVKVVIYTESQTNYTTSRIVSMGLDPLVDFVYSPATHSVDEALSTEHGWFPSGRSFTHAIQRALPFGLTKPNPQVLRDILTENNLQTLECVYVGDSLMKDITMAQHAGVPDVLAAYGDALQHPGYDLLRSVSHWPDSDVEKERNTTREIVRPTNVIHSFAELKAYF